MGKAKSVLVTGAAGFIGSHLADALIKKGFSVRAVDNLTNGNKENLKFCLDNPRFEFYNEDLKNAEAVEKLLNGIDLAFHFAANPDVKVGVDDPAIHFNENLLVTFNVLEAMRKSKRGKLMVFPSSSTVYGEPEVFPTPEDYGPLFPISVYGAAKLGGESLISSYSHTFDMRGVMLRFANIVGSRATHGVVIDFIRKLRRNPSELEILGDGTQTKSYLHVEDLINAIFVILEDFLKKDDAVDVYNVGSWDQINVKRIASVVCQELNLDPPKYKFKCTVAGGGGWKGDVKTMQLSIEKLLKLGWKPSLNSEEAIRRSCRELMENV